MDASAAVWAASSQNAFRSWAVNFSSGVTRAGSQRRRSLGGQIGGELPAAEPHRSAVLGGVAGQRDGVSGDLGGVTLAQPLADQHPGAVEAGEELLLAGCSSCSGADRTLEREPRRFPPSAAPGLLVLRAGRTASRSPIAGSRAPQPVPFLGSPACLADPVALVRQPGLAAVLAGQHRDDMDVVSAVADGDPADCIVVLPVGCQPGAVHDVGGDLRPLVVGQRVVLRGGADRAVPDGAVEPARPECRVQLLEQAAELSEVAVAVGAQRRFEFSWVAPSGYQVRVGVFFAASGAEQGVDQPGDSRAAWIADLRDHRSLRRISSAAASRRSARRRHAAAYGSRSPERCPVAFSFATAWFRFTPIRRTSPGKMNSTTRKSPHRGVRHSANAPRHGRCTGCGSAAPELSRMPRLPGPLRRGR